MSIRNSYRFLAPAALLFGGFVAMSASAAPSHCKGMSESVCASDSSCTWVQGYVRKDGRQVSSHCKLARGRKAVDLSAAAEPAQAAKQR
ncbi:MAG: hypothetical protein QNJ91_04060 [Gammaproteobacteria bacterium]|nr:hypothetical protein [Gammaproteobacteria bacterium]